MTMRALILLLVVLNLGVAAWWAWHPDGAVAPTPDASTGIARLQLLAERGDRPAAAAPVAAASTTPAPEPSAPPATCLRIGPFADAAAAQDAVTALQSLATGLRARERSLDSGRGWNVGIAPQADRAAVDALAARLRAAGFTDLAIIGDGAGANGIALGRFSSEERARKHESDLKAAGFDAVASPVGEARIEHWVDGRLRPEAALADVRRRAGAAPVQASECPGAR